MDTRMSWEWTAAETDRQLMVTRAKINFITRIILPIGERKNTARLFVLFCIILHDLKINN
jgi:hypothetical protein